MTSHRVYPFRFHAGTYSRACANQGMGAGLWTMDHGLYWTACTEWSLMCGQESAVKRFVKASVHGTGAMNNGFSALVLYLLDEAVSLMPCGVHVVTGVRWRTGALATPFVRPFW